MTTTRWMLVSMVCLGALYGCKATPTQDQPTAESPRVERPPSPYLEVDERTYTDLLARADKTPAPFDYDHDYTAPKNPRAPRTLEDLEPPKVPGATREPEAPPSTPVDSYTEPDTTPGEAPTRTYPSDPEEVKLWKAAYYKTGKDYLTPYCNWMVDQGHVDGAVLEAYSLEHTPPKKEYIAHCMKHAPYESNIFTTPKSPHRRKSISITSSITLKATRSYESCENSIHEVIRDYEQRGDDQIPVTDGFSRARKKSERLEARCRADELAFWKKVIEGKLHRHVITERYSYDEITYTHLKPVDVITFGRNVSKHLITTSSSWMEPSSCKYFLGETRNDEFITCTEEDGPRFTVDEPGVRSMQSFFNAYNYSVDMPSTGRIQIEAREDMIAVLAVEKSSPRPGDFNHAWYELCDDCEGSAREVELYNAAGEAIMSFSFWYYA